MRHPARTVLAALSLLACIVSAGACVVSYVVPVGITNRCNSPNSMGEISSYSQNSLAVNQGRFCLHRTVFTKGDPSTHIYDYSARSIGVSIGSERFMQTWLPYQHGVSSFFMDTVAETQWTVPLWVLVPVFAVLPIRCAVLRRRDRLRVAAAVCVRCGYDLRASRGRCPECGEAIRVETSARF
jgi:hypothetical protein